MPDARIRLDNARKLFDAGRYAQAAENYSAVVAADATCAFAFSERARCHYRMGLLNMALADVSRAIELSPQTASYRFTRGRYCLEAGQFHDGCVNFAAVIDLEDGQQERPFSEAAALFRAEANLELKQFKEALRDCTRIRDDISLYVRGRLRTRADIERDARAGLAAYKGTGK